MSEPQITVTYEGDWSDVLQMVRKRKEEQPKKGDVIHIKDERYGVSVRALVDDISKDGTRMTLSKLKEDE